VPYQEMSDARQMVNSVEEEFNHLDAFKDVSVKNIMASAKQQLELARNSLEENKYDEARDYANKAKGLAALARQELQQKSK
jgi:hypothetical protein